MNNNNSKLVTVVTITYNLINADREEAFRRCVASVFNQSYKNIEHLIIDGASTDGTLELIAEYKNCTTCYSEKDNGIYFAMNKGIDTAKGDYIIFLNSDDYFNNMYAIEKLVKELEFKNADFACGSVMTEHKKGLSPFYPILSSFFQTMPFSHQSLLCKTSILKNIGKFDTQFKLGADLDLIIRLILEGYKPCVIQDYIANYDCAGASGCQYNAVIEDYANSFMQRYEPFYKLSKEEALALAKFKKIDDNFYLNLINYIKEKNPYIYYYFFDENYLDKHTLKNETTHKRYHIKLFNVIPIFKIIQNLYNYKLYLFELIPIYRFKNTLRKTTVYICSIPIIDIFKRLTYYDKLK